MGLKAMIAEELASRLKSGDSMAMDFASRMQRAKDMGFDTSKTYYHGTDADISAFDPKDSFLGRGTYFSSTPEGTKRYHGAEEGANIVPANIRGKIAFNDPDPVLNQKIKDYGLVPLDGESAKNAYGRLLDQAPEPDVQKLFSEAGYSGVNVLDKKSKKNIQVFDPSNIRSVNAAFDPAKKESSNLLAGIGALGAGTTAALYTPEENQAYADQLTAAGRADLIPSGYTIEADEFPRLQQAGDLIDKYTETPFGPALQGVTDYLRGFGDNADAKEKAKRALMAALDVI